ncbi:High mobility group B protein [Melia azedarach]|uniref:High mobility group B protein n=1 Tax=Melia azedarach TaxID=155640 RepID=A0ACC1WYK6_MELAZ|nr:High mobility group B protein [Melia azedarach]
MAKKATEKSKNSQSSSASSASETASNQKMVLRKRPSQQSIVASEKEEKPYPAKKLPMKKKKKHGKLDPKKPKKPPTAFFYFLEDFRKEFQEQNPDIKSMRDIGKACGEKWKTMTYEDKVKYYDIATEKRAEFDSAMADYIKRKESGESQDTEDDSEFDEYD